MKPRQARVLLTGATGGIGREAASALRAAGARVMLSARQAQPLGALADELRQRHGGDENDVRFLSADLRDPSAVDRLAGAAAAWSCNVVVHAAGAPGFGPLASHDAQRIANVLQTNVVAPMLLTRALLPHLRRQPHAQVLCIGSVLGAIGLPGYTLYSASKFGLRGFAQALRRELAGTSVKVQYLGPRSTRTGFNDARVDAYNLATGTATDGAGDVAAAIVRVLEDEAAERFLGFPEWMAVRINGALPTALDGTFRVHAETLRDLPSLTRRSEP